MTRPPAMGVKYLSKKLRSSKETPDEFSTDRRLKGKRIAVDLSVILHKALGTNDGAAYYQVKPTNPNCEVVEKCSRICGWAKLNDILLVVSVDGRSHPMKASVNKDRTDGRDSAQARFEAMVQSEQSYDKIKIREAFKLMKKATFVR